MEKHESKLIQQLGIIAGVCKEIRLDERQEITHVLCLAHARRKFDEAA